MTVSSPLAVGRTAPCRWAKRLLYIANLISAEDSQHFVHLPPLLNELEKLGWQVELVSERGGAGVQQVSGRSVRYLSRSSRLKRLFNLARLLVRYRLSGGRLVFVRISKPAAWTAGLFGRLLGWKTLYWLSGTVEDFNATHGGWKAGLGRRAMWLMLRAVDHLATGPETMVDYYRSTYGLPASKLLLLYNDINVDSVPERVTPEISNPATVLMVHRLSPVREHSRYLPALLSAISTCRTEGASPELHIVGDGPERPRLEGVVQDLGATDLARFHGAVPNRLLHKHYERATLFIMPSYREGFPRVILEAMARGVPIVATDAGGTRDLLGPLQQRYVFSRDDAEGFARGVCDLLGSPALREDLASENLMQVRRFATPAVAHMYDAVLSGILSAANRVRITH